MKLRKRESVFPVALLTRNRRVLIVGGGKVAAGKLHRLTDFPWSITVLAPRLDPRVEEYGAKGMVETRLGEYRSGDLFGFHLVFAATDDGDLNRRILDDARSLKIPACAVDHHWNEGDFITPALIHSPHGIAAFSSGGLSCRTTRLVKASLSRQLRATENWEPVVIGTSHHQLGIDRREGLCLDNEGTAEQGRRIAELRAVHEFVILSTCNRIEFYGLVSPRSVTLDMIITILKLEDLSPRELYRHRGFDAMAHLSMVGAGILSQTPGENHIVSQLKTAMAQAEREGWAGAFMKDWFAKSLHVSKHIRANSKSHLKYKDLEDLVASYLDRNANPGARILLIGSGAVGRPMAAELSRRGCTFDWAYYRNPPPAPEGVDVVPMAELTTVAGTEYDVLITAVSRPEPYTSAELPGILKKNGLALDLGVPRNLGPDWADEAETVDMEDLKYWYRRNMADTKTIFDLSQKEIERHRKDYDKLVESL